eukprot:681210-Prymnesium_polylepis.1
MAVPVRGRGAWSHSMVRYAALRHVSRRRRVGPWSFHGTWVTRDTIWIQSFQSADEHAKIICQVSQFHLVLETHAREKTEKRDDAMRGRRNPRR